MKNVKKFKSSSDFVTVDTETKKIIVESSMMSALGLTPKRIWEDSADEGIIVVDNNNCEHIFTNPVAHYNENDITHWVLGRYGDVSAVKWNLHILNT